MVLKKKRKEKYAIFAAPLFFLYFYDFLVFGLLFHAKQKYILLNDVGDDDVMYNNIVL